jgi:hypothetical protein
MTKTEITSALHNAIEVLASVEHKRWAHWQRHVHSSAIRQADGSLLIPVEVAARRERQIATPYADLSEDEKQADCDQVHRYLPVIERALGCVGRTE